MFHISKRMAFALIFVIASLLVHIYRSSRSGPLPSSIATSPFVSFPGTTTQLSPLPQGSRISEGMQLVKSLLGVDVRFFKGNINYVVPKLLQDPRYQALTAQEKLVDAIQFQPFHEPAYLLLVAIARKANGLPDIVPAKFDIVRQTSRGGLVLKDQKGRLFYYSGYIINTPLWKSLYPGQILQDSFCKNLDQMAFCPSKNALNVSLRKPANPFKDIPLLLFLK